MWGKLQMGCAELHVTALEAGCLFIWTLSPNGSTRHYFLSTIVTLIVKNESVRSC